MKKVLLSLLTATALCCSVAAFAGSPGTLQPGQSYWVPAPGGGGWMCTTQKDGTAKCVYYKEEPALA